MTRHFDYHPSASVIRRNEGMTQNAYYPVKITLGTRIVEEVEGIRERTETEGKKELEIGYGLN